MQTRNSRKSAEESKSVEGRRSAEKRLKRASVGKRKVNTIKSDEKTVKLGKYKDSPQITISKSVSMSFATPTNVFFGDGFVYKYVNEKLAQKYMFNKEEHFSGAFLFNWPHLGATVKAILVPTAHGDGVYPVFDKKKKRGDEGSAQAVWVDAGCILIMSAESKRKLDKDVEEEFPGDDEGFGTAEIKDFVGTLVAHKGGYVTDGEGKIVLDTR